MLDIAVIKNLYHGLAHRNNRAVQLIDGNLDRLYGCWIGYVSAGQSSISINEVNLMMYELEKYRVK